MVQIKLSLASFLIATVIAPAVSQPVFVPKGLVEHDHPHPHPHPHPHNHNHPGGNHHHHSHHGDQQAVSNVVGTTQPTTGSDAGDRVTREYVDWLEVRSPVHIPKGSVPHVHYPHPHGHQAVSIVVDATQPTDPNANVGNPVTREYVDELFRRYFDYLDLDARDLDLD